VTLSVSSAFFERLQEDGIQIVELVDLFTPNGSFHWTTGNEPLTAALSGQATTYDPFPGRALGGGKRNAELKTSALQFLVANSGSVLGDILSGQELHRSTVTVARVFPDTPDLDRMVIFDGSLGAISWDRNKVQGQVRDGVRNLVNEWPPYSYHDKCSWRFGGQGCGVDTSSFTITLSGDVAISASSSSKAALWVNCFGAAFADDHFTFGRLTATGGVNSGSVRTVRVHTGSLLGLSHGFPATPQNSDSYTLFPGCRKRLVTDCHSKYDNADRFMGFKWIPLQEDGF